MPHICECKICGAKMSPAITLDPRPGAVMPAIIGGWLCTKHGPIFGPDCEHCRSEQAGAKP